jgi:hypothetical protein
MTPKDAEQAARWRETIELDGLRKQVATLKRMLAEATGEAKAKPKKAQPTDGHVYYLRNGWNIKIGWTSNLQRRLGDYPPDSQLLAVHPGTRKDERAIHAKFRHLLTDGREWFPAAPQILEHIENVKREHGEPPVIQTRRKASPIKGPRLNKYVGGPNRGPLLPRELRG